MTAATSRSTPTRVRSAYVEGLDERLSARDWRVIMEVNRLRVVSGEQLERLCFSALHAGRSRTVTRSRVLARLVRWRVLVPVGRRVGGSGRGSTGQAFALDVAGRRLLMRRGLAQAEHGRVRRPGTPGERSLRHLLAVSQLSVDLVEQTRQGGQNACTFTAEPGSWWPNGRHGWLKPDAHVVLEREGARDHWWVEVDLATESLPTVRGKIQAYLDFQARGERGLDDVMPWVLIATVTRKRRDAIRHIVRRLPDAEELVTVVESEKAAAHMMQVLREWA
jgi:Replication-relaxation